MMNQLVFWMLFFAASSGVMLFGLWQENLLVLLLSGAATFVSLVMMRKNIDNTVKEKSRLP